MKNKVVLIIIVTIALIIFSACDKEDPDNIEMNTINVGIFEFEIPDYYDIEPVEKTPNYIIYKRPEEKDNCQLSFVVIPYDYAYTRDYEMYALNTYLDTLALENVETWGKDDLSFTGEKDGVKMKGVMDTVYCSSSEEAVNIDEGEMIIVAVLYNEEKVSPYYYGDDLNDIINSATVDGYEGVFSMTSDQLNDYTPDSDTDSNSDNWDTDSNGEADWRDVDTNNDGDVSQDEMNQYLDDWEKEENESDGGASAHGSGTYGD